MKTNYREPNAEECYNCRWRRVHAVDIVYYCAHNTDANEPVSIDAQGISMDGVCDDFEYLEDGEEQ